MATSYAAGSDSSTRFQLRLDRICRSFERRWRSSMPLFIEDCLGEIEPSRRAAALHELIATELDLRLEAGESPSADEYARRFPAAAASIAQLFAEACPVSSAAPRPDERFTVQLGKRLGEYRIIREIGRGGMGIVYEALQESLHRRVAIKILPFAATLNPSGRRRFRQEALTAAKLKHRNIVSVYAAATEEAIPYIVMELIEGNSLADWIRGSGSDRSPQPDSPRVSSRKSPSRIGGLLGPGADPRESAGNAEKSDGNAPESARKTLKSAAESSVSERNLSSSAGDAASQNRELATSPAPVSVDWQSMEGVDPSRRLARIGLDVARALAFAHSHAVLHRDVKPSNLLIDRLGDVRLADFGLARSLDDEGTTTVSGEFLGTLRYAAPETFQGEYDHRSDIYSLGVTLYELATRAPAFAAPTREKLLENIVRGLPALWPRQAVCSRDLRTIIRKAMAPEAKTRYDSAAELAEDLERFLEGHPILARRPSVFDQVAGWCRRQPLLASLAGTLLLTLVAGFVLSMWLWRDAVGARERMATERTRAVASEAVAKMQRQVADQAARNATLTAAELQHAIAIRELEARNDGMALLAAVESLRLAEQARAGPEQTIDKAAAFAAGLTLQESNRWLVSALATGMPIPVARASIAERVQHWQLLNPSIKVGRELPTLRFAPDGGSLFVGTQFNSDVHRWRPAEGLLRPLLEQPSMPGVVIHYCGEMKYAVIQRPDNTLEYWDVAAGRRLRILEFNPRSQDGLRLLATWLSPDTKRLLVFAFNRFMGPACWLHDTASGKVVGQKRPPNALAFQAWFSPDSRYVQIEGSRTQLWKTDDFTLVDDDLPARALPVFNEHEVVLGLPHEIQIRRLDAPAIANAPKSIPLPIGAILSAFHVDNDLRQALIGTRDGEILAVDLVRERVEQRVRHGKSPISHLVPSPDGRTLLVADTTGRIGLWDMSLRSFFGNVVEQREELASLAWSPDSRSFATATIRGELAVWRRPVKEPALASAVSLIALSPDQERLLLVHRDGRLSVKDLATGRDWRRLAEPIERIKIAVWSPRSDRIALAKDASDPQPIIWDLAARSDDSSGSTHLARLPSFASRPIAGLCFGSGGRRLFVHSPPYLSGYDLERWFPTGAVPPPSPSPYVGFSLVPGPFPQKLHLLADQRTLIGCLSPSLANHDLSLHYWDQTGGRMLYEVAMPPGRFTHQMILAPDGQTLLAAGDYGLLVWPTSNGQERKLINQSASQELLQVIAHPTAPLVATIGRDQVIRCFNYRTGESVGQPIRCFGNLLRIAWSTDGRTLQSVTASTGLQLWDWIRGQPLAPPLHVGEPIEDSQFSARRNRWMVLAAGGSGEVNSWEPPSPSDRPVAEWRDRAGYLTGFELSPTQEQPIAVPVDRWRTLRDQFAAPATPPGKSVH
jgi:serine/threonine protein kinase/WD40 repeat protein